MLFFKVSCFILQYYVISRCVLNYYVRFEIIFYFKVGCCILKYCVLCLSNMFYAKLLRCVFNHNVLLYNVILYFKILYYVYYYVLCT
jgi:hypothetical protein